jgi:dTDP-4-dehydrorhamnose reductase
VTGGNGQLGVELNRVLFEAGDEVLAVSHHDLDVADREAVHQLVGAWRPECIIHGAAWTNVDGCEADPTRAYLVNAWGSRNVAEAAELVRSRVVAVSTDYVFDGRGGGPNGGQAYTEWDTPNPISAYGRSKLGGERDVIDILGPRAAIVRTAWVCSQHGQNFMNTMIRLAKAGADERTVLPVVSDQHGSPTFTADLAVVLRALAVRRLGGIFHASNVGPTTWFEFAQAIFVATGHDPERVQPTLAKDLVPQRPAPRPEYSLLAGVALDAAGVGPLPHWNASLQVALTGLGLWSPKT